MWPRAGSSNGSFGGLYTECTTTPGITIVMISTVPWTFFVDLLHLQIVLYEDSTTMLVVCTSTTSDIPAIFGLGRLVDQCVSWRHKQ